jgi:hypothetical protein
MGGYCDMSSPSAMRVTAAGTMMLHFTPLSWRTGIVSLLVIFGAVLSGSETLAASAETPTISVLDVELWRLDCGDFVNFDISGMSDVFAYEGKRKTLTNSSISSAMVNVTCCGTRGFRPQ